MLGKFLRLVMYSIVMRPESLPKSYQDLIQKTGPVAKPVYKAVRDCCRGGPVDVASISAYLSSRGKLNVMKLEEFPSIIPCSIIHPETDSCLGHNAKAASATFRKTFPLYFFPEICTICCSAPTEGTTFTQIDSHPILMSYASTSLNNL
ncbi:hypothetical protein WN944_019356 [Citrus x changshan-huyou]|uniref:Uncharacterized protein n=1 Tax=Citrus x changshan-huyou TaxID=2935761 RepID=A0AAP0LV38_9ROSI